MSTSLKRDLALPLAFSVSILDPDWEPPHCAQPTRRADWEASARSLKPKPRLTEITVPRSRSVPKHKEGEGPGREAGMDSSVGRGGGRRRRTYRPGRLGGRANGGGGGTERGKVRGGGAGSGQSRPSPRTRTTVYLGPNLGPGPFCIHRVPLARRLSLGLGTTSF